MSRRMLDPTAWPILGLSLLLTAACLAATVLIDQMQEDLGRTLREDAARLQAAQQAQIHLREYRFHTVLLATGSNEERRSRVGLDRQRLEAALEEIERLAASKEDRADLEELRDRWEKYEAALTTHPARSDFPTVEALSEWADHHQVSGLLVPCGRLVERSQARMAATEAASAAQSRWAGRTLLVIGFIGPIAGLVSGYLAARQISRRVARLSVRVQAARSHLDQDVGSVTVERSDSLADIDEQLGTVVDRIGFVCRRLQEQERELLRAEQLAAVGNLAAGVAHEIRNPLTGIKMLVEAAIRPSMRSPLTEGDLHLIRDEITRLERTVQGLLAYAKPTPICQSPGDLRPVVARSLELVAPLAERANVTMDFHQANEPCRSLIDADQITSLLTNLLINAVEATPAHGRVWVEIKRQVQLIEISVNDTGRGINPEVAGDLFTPFVTTKKAGTGLGLVVARRVARDHGGDLVAEARPEGGTRFLVTLPAVDPHHGEASDR